jgi:hypothetical protein
LNPVTVLKSSYLVIENPEAAVAILEARVQSKKLTKKLEKQTK